jgi:hypothetical protein
MRNNRITDFGAWANANQVEELPFIVLPSGDVTISACAKKLFELIAPTKQLFMRGRAAVILVERDDGSIALELLHASAARSFFEKFARLFAWRAGAKGEPVLKPSVCAERMADALLQTEEAQQMLPRIEGLINCPIIREVNGQLLVAGQGYDEQTHLLVTGGKQPPEVRLAEAVQSLKDLFAEFDFQTEADKARAVASVISPALKLGGHLKGRVPADVAEADQSQSGKTYRQKLIAAIYNERVSLVTNREGGVGSIDESLSQQLIAGRPFIQFDNFRGRFASAHLEAFLTAEAAFPCRVPHRGEVSINPQNYFILLSSNGLDTTRDFANRSNIVRIRKKPAGFSFRTFPEGDLLEHVRANQPFYLGCVFAVLRSWHDQGKLRTKETRHDFREWVQVVDAIVQTIVPMARVMDGHPQAQERVSSPALIWLRKVVLAINEAGELDRALTATDLYMLCDEAGIEIPGMRTAADCEKGKRVVGALMAKLFRERETIAVDQFTVTRQESSIARKNSSAGGSVKSKTYTVSRRAESEVQLPLSALPQEAQ